MKRSLISLEPVVGVVSALAFSLSGCAASHSSSGATEDTDSDLVKTDPQAYGINVHRPTGTLARQLLDKVRGAGFRWVRIDVVWEDIESVKGVFNWEKTDDTVRAAAARGLNIYANLHDTPKWANGNKSSKVAAQNPQDWVKFCRAFALRYDGTRGLPKITTFGLWNEPDGMGLGESGDSQDKKLNDYVRLILKPGYQAIHAVRPDARVAAPDLAAEKTFLTRMLQNAKDSVDIVSIHKYSDEPRGVASYTDDIVRIMRNAGLIDSKPLWLTETGWTTRGRHGCWFDPVDDATQARRSVDLLKLFSSSARGRVEKVFFYELIDDDRRGACQWGLLRSDQSEKPSYGAIREFIAANAGLAPASPSPDGDKCKPMVTKTFSDGVGVLINSKNSSGNPATHCNESCTRAGKGYSGCAASSCIVPGTRDDALCRACAYTKLVEESTP